MKKILSIMLAVTLLLTTSLISFASEDAATPISRPEIQIQEVTIDDAASGVVDDSLVVDASGLTTYNSLEDGKSGRPLPDTSNIPKAKRTSRMSGDIALLANVHDELNLDVLYNLYFFTTTSAKSMYVQLKSSGDYTAYLCTVDYSTGDIYDTGVSIDAGNAQGLGDTYLFSKLPANDYCWYVTHNGTVGYDYQFQMNATSPSGTYLATATNDLQKIVTYATDKSAVYLNGTAHLTSGNYPSEYRYNYSQSNSGGYYSMLVNVYSLKEKQSLGIVNYTTSMKDPYTGASFSTSLGVLVKVGLGTGLQTVESSKIYDTNGKTISSQYITTDASGKSTPRYLDAEDVSYSNYLIYDLNKGKFVGFYSPLNPLIYEYSANVSYIAQF